MKIKSYSDEKLNALRASGKILAKTHEMLREHVRAGVSTMELNNIADKFIRENGAEPSFFNYNGFKYSICTSVNEASIHGMPSARVLKDGDIISIDIGVRFDGMCTDAARTWPVGKIADNAKKLIEVTEQSFWESIKGLKAMQKVGTIGDRIEDFVRANSDFSLIENYFGHGVGDKVHENPLIPHFKATNKTLRDLTRVRLPLHSVIAIEPMVNEGVKEVETAEDGWTAVTADGKLAAHYENTVIILADGVEVVTV